MCAFNHPSHPEDLAPEARLRLMGLTPRETEVALLAARGFSVREISQRLQVMPGTVKTLLARARAKLGYRNVRQLMTMFLRVGLIRADQLVDPFTDNG